MHVEALRWLNCIFAGRLRRNCSRELGHLLFVSQPSEGGMMRLHRAQISQFELFELTLLSKLNRQFPAKRFEATVSQSSRGAGARPNSGKPYSYGICVCIYIYIYV